METMVIKQYEFQKGGKSRQPGVLTGRSFQPRVILVPRPDLSYLVRYGSTCNRAILVWWRTA